MTSEQNEQWKEAILPLVMRFTGEQWEAEHALLALLPAPNRLARLIELCGEEQLKAWSVPSWVSTLRLNIFAWALAGGTAPWIPYFALRSAAGLLGIQICHQAEEDREALYQRFMVRWVREVLHPFVALAKKGDRQRRKYYWPILTLYKACDEFFLPGDLHRFALQLFHLREMGERQRSKNAEQEAVYRLVCDVATTILIQGNLAHLVYRGDSPAWNPSHMLPSLSHLHGWRLNGGNRAGESEEQYCIDQIADAFLSALEAECPLPDWLPTL